MMLPKKKKKGDHAFFVTYMEGPMRDTQTDRHHRATRMDGEPALNQQFHLNS